MMSKNIEIIKTELGARNQKCIPSWSIKTRLSFCFKNGNSWHVELNKSSTESELLHSLTDLTELIRKHLSDNEEAPEIIPGTMDALDKLSIFK